MLNCSDAKASIKCMLLCVVCWLMCVTANAHAAHVFSTQLTDATSSIRSERELHIKMTCIYFAAIACFGFTILGTGIVCTTSHSYTNSIRCTAIDGCRSSTNGTILNKSRNVHFSSLHTHHNFIAGICSLHS